MLMKSANFRPGLVDAVGLILVCGVIFAGGSLAGDPGFGWHLSSGRWIAEHHAVPSHDIFPTISQGRDWVHSQWLGDYIFWTAFAIGDFALLKVLTTLVLVAAFLWLPLFAARIRGYEASGVQVFLFLLLATLAGSVQWFVRPVIYSFLCFSLLLALLPLHRPNIALRFRWLAVPALFALWANLHPAFVLGLGILGLFLFARIAQAPLGARLRVTLSAAAYLLVCTAATLLNPFGVDVYREMLTLVSSSFFMTLNSEWKRTDFSEFNFLPHLCLLVFAGASVWYQRRSLGFLRLVLVLLFALLSLAQRRYVPFFSLVALHVFLPVVAQSSWRLLPRVSAADKSASRFACTLLLLLGLAAFAVSTGTVPGKQRELFPEKHPVALVEHLRKHPAQARVFHSPDWGGFFIWHFGNRLSLFIDDRNQLHGEQPYRDYFCIMKACQRWEELVRQYGFDVLVVADKTPIVEVLRGSAQWQEDELSEQGGELLVFRQAP